MKIKRFISGNLESNTYILYPKELKTCVIIDPGYEADKIIEFIRCESLKPSAILLTHGHHDHTGAADKLRDTFNCKTYIHELDEACCGCTVDGNLYHSQSIKVGDEEIRVLHTPGHTEGSVCFYIGKSKVALTGDTLFSTDLGRTDLKGGNEAKLKESCMDVIDRWGNDVTIYPGHEESCNMKFVRTFNNEFKENVKKDIKLIALDLDGTTLDSNKSISDRTRNAIINAIKKDVQVVIATGRTFSSLPKAILDIENLEYIITGNGAVLTRLCDNRVIYSNFIDGAVMNTVIDMIRCRTSLVEVFVDGKAYIQRDIYDSILNRNFRESHKEYIRETRTPIEDIFSFMFENKEKIENVSILFENQEERQKLKAELEKVREITVTTSFDHNIEIGGATTSKADAIKYLSAILKIGKENVMACGDSLNDIPMLELAALPVAMGNAKPEVKEISKFITASNLEDGVAKAIEKFVL